MKKVIVSLLVLVMILSLTACGSVDSTDNRIKVSKSSSDFKGKDYKDVMTLLQVAGFTNIEVEVIDDLITGWLTKDGEVEKVSINGSTDFSASSKFTHDSKIVIAYHTFPVKVAEQVPKKTDYSIPSELAEKLAKITETSKATEPTRTSGTSTGTTKGTTKSLAEPLDLNAINNTNSAKSDALFIGKYYRVTGIIDQAMKSADGLDAMVIIEPDVMAKGMGLALPLEINIWLTVDEFQKIGGVSSVGKQIDISVKLTSIHRDATSKDPAVKGYPIQLEFGTCK